MAVLDSIAPKPVLVGVPSTKIVRDGRGSYAAYNVITRTTTSFFGERSHSVWVRWSLFKALLDDMDVLVEAAKNEGDEPFKKVHAWRLPLSNDFDPNFLEERASTMQVILQRLVDTVGLCSLEPADAEPPSIQLCSRHVGQGRKREAATVIY